MKFKESIIQKIEFNRKEIYLKRDDLLHDDFSGNKARKFFYFLNKEFPSINTLISHGSPQSNAMYSLSVLCKMKDWKFDYYVDHIPKYLKDNPIGNYKKALENNMNIYEKKVPTFIEKDALFIKEGGALHEAKYGIEILANELKSWIENNNMDDVKIFLPSGTGTTALYLQHFLPYEVLTCACVGDEKYLKKQFEELERFNHPTIIKRKKKYHFGKLYQEFYLKYKELLNQTNIEFDLLYDSLGWICLEEYLEENKDSTIIYIHQGGLIGNESMIERYKYKYNEF